MSFRGPNQEVKQNELFDMQEKGYFKAGATEGTFVLSDFGKNEFERLVKSLPAKDQVMIRMSIDSTDKTGDQIKDFMEQ